MIKYIYVLIDPRNNEIKYVGQTIKNINIRLNEHILISKCKSHKNANWIKKLIYLNLKPIIKCIDIVPIEDLGFWEMFYIFKFKKEGIILNNHTLGGDGTLGYKHTIRWKKIRGKKYTGKGNPFYGKKHNDITKSILSKIDRKNDKNGMYNKTHNEESKKIMSLKKKDIYLGDKNPRSRCIYQYDSNLNLINKWTTAKECADLYNLSRGNISSSANYNDKIDIENNIIRNKMKDIKQYINKDNYDDYSLQIEQYKKQLKKYKTVKGFIFKFFI